MKEMFFGLKKAKKTMQERGLDALVAVSPENLYYTTGVPRLIPAHTQYQLRGYLENYQRATRLGFYIIPCEGVPTMIVSNVEETLVKSCDWIKDYKCYVELKSSPIEALSEVLKEKGLENGRIGIDKDFISAVYYEELCRRLPDVSLINSTPIFARIRTIKTEREIEILEKAAKTTERAIQIGYEMARKGDTERNLAKNMVNNLIKLGADYYSHILLGGAHIVHAFPTSRQIKPGDAIRADLHGIFSAYFSDVTRMAFVGKPSERSQKYYKGVVMAQRNVIDHVRPGVKVSDLYKAYAKTCEELNMPISLPFCGHGLGLELHEFPMIYPDNNQIIEKNMILSIEIGCFVENIGGFAIEDTVLVTESGCRIFTNYMEKEDFHQIH